MENILIILISCFIFLFIILLLGFNQELNKYKKEILKKELKIRNYWDDELFKINEGNKIDFNFRKLIKSIKNNSKSTLNNI